MALPITSRAKLHLKDMLDRGETAIATFEMLKGARTAQIIANTGLDVC
jgi:hypothetical protein